MTLPSSGPISASDIINEFGATRDNSSNPDRTRLGDYRKVSSSPTSGNPSFSNNFASPIVFKSPYCGPMI